MNAQMILQAIIDARDTFPKVEDVNSEDQMLYGYTLGVRVAFGAVFDYIDAQEQYIPKIDATLLADGHIDE